MWVITAGLKVILTGTVLTALQELQAAVTGTAVNEKWSWLVMLAAVHKLAKSLADLQPVSI
jgi:hypothetical protein